MRALILAAALLIAPAAHAAVDDVSPSGFTVVQKIEIKESPDVVWAALVTPADWWNSEHTWSGNARNLSMDLKPGGCFCEALPPGGYVRHLELTQFKPGKALNFFGSLGPLSMSGASGNFMMTVQPTPTGTAVTWTYAVGGYTKGGLDKWAAPVDGVLGEQLGRLKTVVERGRP